MVTPALGKPCLQFLTWSALPREEWAAGDLGEPQCQVDKVNVVAHPAVVVGEMTKLIHGAQHTSTFGLRQCLIVHRRQLTS
jgi:hypothetical protein